MIKARRLRASEIPERAALYGVWESRDIAVEEKQKDGSLDRVTLQYRLGDGDTGYFAKEYLPEGVNKTGAKRIDITAVMAEHAKKCVRWHLYDIKDTLAGENTVVQLHDQWSCGLGYLQNVLKQLPGYTVRPDLGVITRSYDRDRMIRLREEYQKRCDEAERDTQGMSLAQRKKRTDIAKYRGTLRAAEAILNGRFQAESGDDTYVIHIRQLSYQNNQIYKMEFIV